MPKRTPAQRAADATPWHRMRIQEAYEGGELDAPLDASLDWLKSMLSLAARHDTRFAVAAYDKATRTVAELAASVGSQIAAGGSR